MALSLLGDESDRHVNFLVALLIRYPEISTVHVTASERELQLSFLLRGPVYSPFIDSLKQRLRSGLDALSKLDGRAKRRLVVHHKSYESLTRLVVSRTLRDLAAEEFSIILGIIKESCGDLLSVDEGQGEFYELFEEDDSIGDTLDALRARAPQQELIGIRDGGRVLVFNEAKL